MPQKKLLILCALTYFLFATYSVATAQFFAPKSQPNFSKLYTKIDTLYKKDPQKIVKLKEALENILGTNVSEEKAYMYQSILEHIKNIEILTLSKENLAKLKKDAFILGEKDARISIIEFSDLECPFCKKLEQDGIIQKVAATAGNTNIIFKHFPLSFHEFAYSRALQAECAGKLGWTRAFYNMIHALFLDISVQDQLKSDKIDTQEFSTCLSSWEFDTKIADSIKQWEDMFHINGTPTTVIVNNKTLQYKIIVWAQEESAFTRAIQQLLWK
jgi:protein-disulfide isomerase